MFNLRSALDTDWTLWFGCCCRRPSGNQTRKIRISVPGHRKNTSSAAQSCNPDAELNVWIRLDTLFCIAMAMTSIIVSYHCQVLGGDCGFLSANLFAKSIFGECALANVSIEKSADKGPNHPVQGTIRIRAKCQVIYEFILRLSINIYLSHLLGYGVELGW